MKNTVATASRDLLAIKRRKYGHYAYRGLQLLTRLGDEERPDDVCLYPALEDEASLRDVLNRLGWYLPERTLRDGVRIAVPTALDVEAAAGAPPGQVEFSRDHLPLEVVAPAAADAAAGDADAILLWDSASRLRPSLLRNLSKVEVVDPGYYSGVESYTWGAFTDRLREPTDGDRATELFRSLEDRREDFERAYVFATGPSLDRATDFEFDDDELKVVCNSIVRNDDILDHIDPDVLVFADPVFHFGPSEYAATFREDAVETLETHDCIGFVPSRHRTLLAGHYPDLDLVGLTGVDAEEPLFPTAEDRRVMSTNNIMTWFMLPIASSLTDEVYILGADGREEDESYFWEHNEDAQYDDELMKSAVDSHPSFFRDRVYTDYYEQHCETLSAFLEYGESVGVDYYSLTHSYVDCLAERRVDSVRED